MNIVPNPQHEGNPAAEAYFVKPERIEEIDDLELIDDMFDQSLPSPTKSPTFSTWVNDRATYIPAPISTLPNPFSVNQNIHYSGGMLRLHGQSGKIIAVHGEYLEIDWVAVGKKPRHKSELIPWIEVTNA